MLTMPYNVKSQFQIDCFKQLSLTVAREYKFAKKWNFIQFIFHEHCTHKLNGVCNRIHIILYIIKYTFCVLLG